MVKNYDVIGINYRLKKFSVWNKRMSGNVWAISVAYQHHIGHVFDSYVQLYHSKFNDKIPSIDYLLHLNFDPKSEIEWNVGMYNLVLRYYNNSIKHIYRDKLSRFLPLCFDKLYLILNYDYPKFFFLFSYKNRKIFRDDILSYLNIKTRVKEGRIGIINRKNRRVLKYNLIFRYLDEINQKYDVVYFEDLNFIDQIKWMNSYRYLIIVHGTVFTNVIWCLNRIGLMEISHRAYYSNYMEYGINYDFVYYRLFSQDMVDYAENVVQKLNKKRYQYADMKNINLKEFIYLFRLIDKKLG